MIEFGVLSLESIQLSGIRYGAFFIESILYFRFLYMPKLSKIINYPLGLLGLRLSRKSKAKDTFNALQDIDADKGFQKVYAKIKPYTMIEPERCYALYHAILYIIRNGIKGDFAECGVWKGGSAMLIVYMLLDAGITDRKIYLYDTFEGMTKPGDNDGEKRKRSGKRIK